MSCILHPVLSEKTPGQDNGHISADGQEFGWEVGQQNIFSFQLPAACNCTEWAPFTDVASINTRALRAPARHLISAIGGQAAPPLCS